MYLQDLLQVKTPGHYSLHNDTLETPHLLLQFPDSLTAVLLLSERVTILIILKGT